MNNFSIILDYLLLKESVDIQFCKREFPTTNSNLCQILVEVGRVVLEKSLQTDAGQKVIGKAQVS